MGEWIGRVSSVPKVQQRSQGSLDCSTQQPSPSHPGGETIARVLRWPSLLLLLPWAWQRLAPLPTSRS